MTTTEMIDRVLATDLSTEDKKTMIDKLHLYMTTSKTEAFETNKEGQLLSKTI